MAVNRAKQIKKTFGKEDNRRTKHQGGCVQDFFFLI